MSVQESIAAALAGHPFHTHGSREPFQAGNRCCDGCEFVGSAEDFNLHLAAVAMDAARQAVEAVGTWPIPLDAGWYVNRAVILDLLTPEGERDA